MTIQKSIRFKVIRPVFETLAIKEPLPDYLAKSRRISSAQDVDHLFRHLAQEAKENFLALHLDTKNKIVCIDRVSTGSLNASIVHPREVLKSTLLSSAAAIILIHNHPSGDPTPSREDMELTKRLKEASDLMGIRVLDHVIIGTDSYHSFADRGLI
jgi:DNA repair protein RadC